MLPINDSEPNHYGSFPIVTILIILACIVEFYWQRAVFGDTNWSVPILFATNPRMMLSLQGGGALSSITTMFLHADMMHLAGNMWMLWIFGRRVEDACGHWRYLLYYITSGTTACILYVMIHWNFHVNAIGASGAISGVMGAYLLLYPGGRIRSFLGLGFLPIPIFPKIPAILVMVFYLGFDLAMAMIDLADPNIHFRVAYWAHVGGYLAAILTPLFLRPAAFSRYVNNIPV